MQPLGLGIMAGSQGLAAIPQIAEGDTLQGATMLGNAAAGTAAQRLAKHLHQPPAGTALMAPPLNPPARLQLPPVGASAEGALGYRALPPWPGEAGPGQLQLNPARRPELWWLQP